MNYVVLIGRIANDININNEHAQLTIAVTRNFKNENGIYDTDFIKINLFKQIAKNAADYCKKGDLIGIKGYITTKDNDTYINAEKITFLTSKRD